MNKLKRATDLAETLTRAEILLNDIKPGDSLSQTDLDVLRESVGISDTVLFGNHGQTWLDIFVRWSRSPFHSKTVDGLQEFLDTQFIAPIEK